MKKKLILSIAIILIIINSLLPNYMPLSFAAVETTQQYKDVVGESKGDTAGDVITTPPSSIDKDSDGTVTKVGKHKQDESSDLVSMIVKVIVKMICAIPYAIQMIMVFVATPENESYTTGTVMTENNDIDDANINWFTIQDAVFGKVPLFNVDFFDVTTDGSSANSNLKTSVVSWYKTCLIIAQVLSIVTLIYIGIRMALATNPDDKSNYKKMLKDWLVGFAILFILHYGIIIILKVVNVLITFIPESISGKNFEKEIIEKSIDIMDGKQSAWGALLYAITYVIIVGYQIYFLIKYFKRLLTMGFLVMIAPLITVTYAIDKVGDGKAQAYETWKKMFISNAFMQPVHAFVYMIFIYSASEIATKAPMIALVFFIGILKAEDIFNKLFKLGDAK